MGKNERKASLKAIRTRYRRARKRASEADSGPWQAAHDWLLLSDKFSSRKQRLTQLLFRIQIDCMRQAGTER